MINQTAFDPVYQYFFRRALFIMPTFQRPFRWEAAQLETLIKDISEASDGGRDHYLSPVHLIEINTLSPEHMNLLNLYTNTTICPPLPVSARLVDSQGLPVEVFLVIDGQQRLTAMLALFTAHALNAPSVPGNYSLNIGGIDYPKLIAGSLAEDDAIRRGLKLPALVSPPVTPTPASTRIDRAFDQATAWKQTWPNHPNPPLVHPGFF